MDTAATWPVSEVNLGHNGSNSGASGCPLTLLKALHQEHTQFIAELLTCHGPPWRPFQRVIPTHCLRVLLPLPSVQQLCTFGGNRPWLHLTYFQDTVKFISELLPLGQITTPSCTNSQGRGGTTGPPSPHFPYIHEASLAESSSWEWLVDTELMSLADKGWSSLSWHRKQQKRLPWQLLFENTA